MMVIVNPFDTSGSESIMAPFNGVVIGLSQLPLTNEGDALVQRAKINSTLADTEYDQEVIEKVPDLRVAQLPVPENQD